MSQKQSTAGFNSVTLSLLNCSATHIVAMHLNNGSADVSALHGQNQEKREETPTTELNVPLWKISFGGKWQCNCGEMDKNSRKRAPKQNKQIKNSWTRSQN